MDFRIDRIRTLKVICINELRKIEVKLFLEYPELNCSHKSSMLYSDIYKHSTESKRAQSKKLKWTHRTVPSYSTICSLPTRKVPWVYSWMNFGSKSKILAQKLRVQCFVQDFNAQFSVEILAHSVLHKTLVPNIVRFIFCVCIEAAVVHPASVDHSKYSAYAFPLRISSLVLLLH